MGQRSQIYVAINGNLIASYFQWNYGERMISRVTGTIQWLKSMQKYLSLFDHEEYQERLRRIMEVNFDMHDIVLSHNILEWAKKDVKNETMDLNNWIFECIDNNNGSAFIDVTEDKIKYCLVPGWEEADNEQDVLKKAISAKEYLELASPNFLNPESSYFDSDTVYYCLDNLNYLKKNAELMTQEELEEFKERTFKNVQELKND